MYTDNNKKQATDADMFRTWWAALPMSTGNTMRASIRAACGWDRHTWWGRIHGRTRLTTAEKNHIVELAGTDIFTPAQEGGQP